MLRFSKVFLQSFFIMYRKYEIRMLVSMYCCDELEHFIPQMSSDVKCTVRYDAGDGLICPVCHYGELES